ncbi:MAG: hypothetical protein ACRC5T_04365 [Cetobacterium sp.]
MKLDYRIRILLSGLIVAAIVGWGIGLVMSIIAGPNAFGWFLIWNLIVIAAGLFLGLIGWGLWRLWYVLSEWIADGKAEADDKKARRVEEESRRRRVAARNSGGQEED